MHEPTVNIQHEHRPPSYPTMQRDQAVTGLLVALTKLVDDLGTALAFLVEEMRATRETRGRSRA